MNDIDAQPKTDAPAPTADPVAPPAPAPAPVAKVDTRAAKRTREAIAAKGRGCNDRDLLAWMQAEHEDPESELDKDTLMSEGQRIDGKTAHPDE